MQKSCVACRQTFTITDDDLALMTKLTPVIGGKQHALPMPTQCPECRQQRRVAQVNEFNLYKRTCGLTGKSIISNFHPKNPHKVYEQETWYSDKWDQLAAGRTFDFSRPFFVQYAELCAAQPLPCLFTGYQYDENSAYTNYSGKNKNCYLIFDSDENRDCLYSFSMNSCIDCVDCCKARTCERCYGCIDCLKCYGSLFLQECVGCSDSAFLKNCISCKNCLMCSNLKNKENYIENKPATKEDVARLKALLTSYSRLQSARGRFEQLKLQYPQKYLHGVQNENVSGDYLSQCKNAYYCFDSVGLWDCRYVFKSFYPTKDAMDCEEPGGDERLYECAIAGYNANSCYFCASCLDQLSDLYYCSFCFHCKNCFGCRGLNRKEYCVFNKQYTREEYETLVPKIIEHMRKTAEWGEFFPVASSPFGYNETFAIDYYPLAKQEALARGWRWQDDVEQERPATALIVIPDDIKDVTDAFIAQVLTCDQSGKAYKITPQELKFYRQMNLPLPRQAFLRRHLNRMAMRNPRKLFDRKCGKCAKAIRTTFAPDRPETVYCEECYTETLE